MGSFKIIYNIQKGIQLVDVAQQSLLGNRSRRRARRESDRVLYLVLVGREKKEGGDQGSYLYRLKIVSLQMDWGGIK